MGVDDHLPQRVVRIQRKLWIKGDVLQKPDHRPDVVGMNAVFRFLEAEHAMGLRIHFQHRERQKTQGAVGQGTGGMLCALPVGQHEGQQLELFITLHSDAVHIAHQFSESVGDAGVDRFRLL